MKRWPMLFLALLLTAVGGAAESDVPNLTDDELGEMYIKATMLLSLGQLDAADETVRQMRVQRPNEPKFIHLQRQIQLARQSAAPNRSQKQLEQQLSRLIIPRVTFRDAQPAAVVDWLRQEGGKLAGDQAPVNLVWMVPPDTRLPGITLDLQNIPLLEVLKYTAQAARLKVRVESHAVVISLPEPAAPPPADVPPQSE